jgi:mono/diheme cytochrome c family protein
VTLSRRSPWSLLALCLLMLTVAGCRGCPSKRPPIDLIRNMDRQPKLIPQGESAFFADGAAMRPPVEGTVARGDLALDLATRTGRQGDGTLLTSIPLPVDDTLLARGEERFGIYCAICHGADGDGRGAATVYGVPTADLHQERIRTLSPSEMFESVSHGVGLMPRYDYLVPVEDRWAIIAYLRQLQGEAAEEAAPGEPSPADATEVTP